MGLFDIFKKKPVGLPHQAGLMFLFRDLVYWVDDGFAFLKNESDIFLDRNNLYLFCAVIIMQCYEIYWFHYCNKDHITKDFLEEYYQSIISVIKTHNNIEYEEAYQITREGVDYFKNAFCDSAQKNEWVALSSVFIFSYTHMEGFDEESSYLASAMPIKCKEITDKMINLFQKETTP